MALATWWRGDPLPEPAPLPGLTVSVSDDVDLIASLASLATDEVEARLDAGHRAYLASINGTPAGYGWVATLSASIGELALAFDLPAEDRYLWDFATLPEWRGRGIYPRLLRAIVEREGQDARRFWIIYAPENAASGSGVAKAGFTIVSDLSFLRDGGVGVAAVEAERAQAGAALLGVPLFEAVLGGTVVSPCWRCVLAAQAAAAESAGCWPVHDSAVSHLCSCVPAVAGAR